jgi:hypothetical protein
MKEIIKKKQGNKKKKRGDKEKKKSIEDTSKL